MTSQQLILAQMHTLDDVTTIVEHAPNVLCVHSTCKVRIAVVLPISTGCNKLISNYQFTLSMPAVYG